MDTSSWRGQLHLEARQDIRGRIFFLLTLGYYHRLEEVDELLELRKIAQSIEQKCYAAATSFLDYGNRMASKTYSLERARERDWRSQQHPSSRQRLVNRIEEGLRTLFLVPSTKGSPAIRRLAQMIEEEDFTLATDQGDYTRRIASRILKIEMRAYQKRHPGQEPPSNQSVVGTDNEHATNSINSEEDQEEQQKQEKASLDS